jgi:hypothetical protein
MALIQRQLNLFDPEPVLSGLGVSRRDLTAWWNSGFLSFDPDAVQRFERWMFEEIAFIAPIARTEFSINAIHAILESLPRPYAYRHADLSFDFHLGGRLKTRY